MPIVIKVQAFREAIKYPAGNIGVVGCCQGVGEGTVEGTGRGKRGGDDAWAGDRSVADQFLARAFLVVVFSFDPVRRTVDR